MKKILLVAFGFLFLTNTFAQQRVMIMEIKSEIDPRTTRYVDLALKHARETEADLVIIEMDTYGGILTDAKETVDNIMHFDKPVWVFINSDAASAGALISIACDSIYMAPGATIGAATVVDATGDKAPDKYQSYMRSIMRSTAEENGRDPKIAEGMVDEDVEVPGVKEIGKILTFSTSEAIANGYCEGKFESINDILSHYGMPDAIQYRFELSQAERIIAWVLNPFISGLLILVIVAGIYFELQTPGFGFAGLAALVALIVYLIPYYLNGLAENWEIIAFLVGVILIALEIFVIPGFGIAGISGIVLMFGSLVLIMIDNNAFDFDLVPAGDLFSAVIVSLGGLLGGCVLLFAMGARLPDMKVYQKVALVDSQPSSEGYVSNPQIVGLKGKWGTAYTVLRPSGKIIIDGQMYDAYTTGEYIEKGQAVEVISDEGPSLKVRSRA